MIVESDATSMLCPIARDPARSIPAQSEQTLRRLFKINRHRQNEIFHSQRNSTKQKRRIFEISQHYFSHLQNITSQHTSITIRATFL
jgi:hypothetical protein